MTEGITSITVIATLSVFAVPVDVIVTGTLLGAGAPEDGAKGTTQTVNNLESLVILTISNPDD